MPRIINKKTPEKTPEKNFKVKKSYLIFPAVLIALIIIGTVVYVKINAFVEQNLLVNNIVITGASPRIKEELGQDLSYLKGHKLNEVNIKFLQYRILQMPWFSRASVAKTYPNTIEVKVIERKPLLIWEDDNEEFYIINSENKIIRKAKVADYKDLILIKKGNLALAKSADIRFYIYRSFNILNKVTKLEYNRYRWDVYLNNGIVIKLPEDYLKKALAKIVKSDQEYHILDRDIKYIDARIPNKLYVMPN